MEHASYCSRPLHRFKHDINYELESGNILKSGTSADVFIRLLPHAFMGFQSKATQLKYNNQERRKQIALSLCVKLI
jgi:hypothetical protein